MLTSLTCAAAVPAAAAATGPERTVRTALQQAGVCVGGGNPWDPVVHDPGFYARVARDGMLGLGDAYVDGWWDCADLPELFSRAIRGGLWERASRARPALVKRVKDAVLNRQSPGRAVRNVAAHYVRRNDLVLGMLDPWRAYSCAFFRDPADPAEGLDAAQERKLGLVCDKLGLAPGHRFADVGCGWGSLLGFAAERRGVRGVGLTPAGTQAAYVRERYGLTVREQDYRQMTGTYDRVASVGMFEHVGRKNYRAYMEVVARCLAADGLFLLHCFGRPAAGVPPLDPWLDRHVFPGGCLPTLDQVHAAADGVLEAVHQDEWGRHYDPTLLAWAGNFEREAERTGLKQRDGPTYRMWRYYLYTCAGAFRSGDVALWQVVFRKRRGPVVYSFR